MPHPFLDADGPIGFAHRGGAGAFPENTERAFRHAVDMGYRYLETDVHTTADGVLVAFHDDSLDRVTDRTGAIADLPWSEVRQARVAGTDPILRLEELMEAFPDSRVNIDPKADHAIEPLARVITDLGLHDRVCVTAFSRRRTLEVKARVGSGLCTGGGATATLRIVARGLPVARLGGVDVLQVPSRAGPIPVVTGVFVRTAHAHGLHVHVWTIDEAAEMEALLDLGVDGIMTDEPATLRDVLRARGHWPR